MGEVKVELEWEWDQICLIHPDGTHMFLSKEQARVVAKKLLDAVREYERLDKGLE